MPLDHPSRELARLIQVFNETYPDRKMNDLRDLGGRLGEFLPLVDKSPKYGIDSGRGIEFRRYIYKQPMEDTVREYLREFWIN